MRGWNEYGHEDTPRFRSVFDCDHHVGDLRHKLRQEEMMGTATKKFYIKQRHNPQLGTYYVACGQLSKREAKAKERSIYGDNVMLCFDTEREYAERLSALQLAGEHVQ